MKKSVSGDVQPEPELGVAGTDGWLENGDESEEARLLVSDRSVVEVENRLNGLSSSEDDGSSEPKASRIGKEMATPSRKTNRSL